MPASSLFSATTSGVAMASIDLQDYVFVLDGHGKGLHRSIGGGRLRPAGGQVEERAAARALDRAGGLVERALGERAVVVRTAVLDRVELPVAVEDADLGAVVLDQAHAAGPELGERADGNGCRCGVVQEGASSRVRAG